MSEGAGFLQESFESCMQSHLLETNAVLDGAGHSEYGTALYSVILSSNSSLCWLERQILVLLIVGILCKS